MSEMMTVEDIQVLISTKIMREQKIIRELEARSMSTANTLEVFKQYDRISALIEVEREIRDMKG